MAHPKHIVHCAGPGDAHAFDGIPVSPRRGTLDALCPACAGHGQWNSEIDLVSQRSKRAICERCDGTGWIETGDDMIEGHDVALSPEGHPMWVVRLDPPEDDAGH